MSTVTVIDPTMTATREIEFRDALPKTDSGKTIRRLLRDEAIAAEAKAGGAR